MKRIRFAPGQAFSFYRAGRSRPRLWRIRPGLPAALLMALNGVIVPFVTAVAVSVSANLAFTIPPAFVPVGNCYAYPYGGGKYTLRWGIVASLVSIVITALLIYPLGMLFA